MLLLLRCLLALHAWGQVASPNPDPSSAQAPAEGRPIVYTGVVEANQLAEQERLEAQKKEQENQALMNAFGSALQRMMGGGGSREIVDPSGDGGAGASGGGSGADGRPTGASDLVDMKGHRIVATFKKYYDGCVQKAGLGQCKFVNMGIMGDASHRARRSCHNSGQAIDVGPLTCSGGQSIRPSDPRFFAVAKCMANDSNNELEVIFHRAEGPNMIRKSDHSGHMHIQLKNCAMVYGR